MSQRLFARVRLFLILVSTCTILGVLDAAFISADDSDPEGILYQVAFSWFLGSVLAYGFEILVVPGRFGEPIRRMHFLKAIAVKSLVLVVIVIIAGMFGDIVFRGEIDPEFFLDPEREFLRTLGIVFLVVFLLQVALQVVRIIGARNLVNFVLGRYAQPIAEDRIFMFLDIAGSTTLAERLGDVGVQQLITQFFFDISEPIAEYGGNIHQYVGDEVVVTWPLGTGAANLRAITCCFAIEKRIRDKAAAYERKFGVVPKFRIGLHGGPIVISQCGDQKQEISYFGDTINTAARVREQCKSFGRSLLVSDELLQRIELPKTVRSQLVGTVRLRGREHPTDLHGVEPA